MMRIAYLTGRYPRATDTFIQREIEALRQQGFEIQTFSVRKPNVEQLVGEEQKKEYKQTFYLLPPKVFLLLIAHLSLIFTGIKRYFQGIQLALKTSQLGIKGFFYQLFYFLEAGILAKQLQSQNIEHLHNHIADSSCTVAMLAAQLSGIPFSFTIHGPYIFFEPYRWALTTKIERASFVACISHFCRSQCMLFSPMDYWEKLYIVHCGVDPSLFKPVTHHGKGDLLLYVGRLAAAKGLPLLLESLARLKERCQDLQLTVIGDGEDRQQLEQLTQNLGLSQMVQFVGYKSQTEVREYLQKHHIFVLPSFAEGVPVSLMEAMASGLPVISSCIAGISELVEDGKSGYLIPPGDVDQLCHKIERLYLDPSLRQSFGIEGRSHVLKNFNLEKEAHWLAKIFQATQQKVAVPIRFSQDAVINL